MHDREAAAGQDDAWPLDQGERAELEWLRAENRLLRTERDVLSRLATGLAEDVSAGLVSLWLHRGRR